MAPTLAEAALYMLMEILLSSNGEMTSGGQTVGIAPVKYYKAVLT